VIVVLIVILFCYCLSVSVKSLPPAFVLSSRDREAVHSELQLLPSECRRTLCTIQLFVQRESIPSSPCGFLYLAVKLSVLDSKLFGVFYIHIVGLVYHRLLFCQALTFYHQRHGKFGMMDSRLSISATTTCGGTNTTLPSIMPSCWQFSNSLYSKFLTRTCCAVDDGFMVQRR